MSATHRVMIRLKGEGVPMMITHCRVVASGGESKSGRCQEAGPGGRPGLYAETGGTFVCVLCM